MRKLVLVTLLLMASWGHSWAQTGIYIPSDKPIKNMKVAMTNPDKFCLLVKYNYGDSTYTTADLDLFDSVYNMAFDRNNPKLYSMIIEGYGDSDEELTQKRVDIVYHYFAHRSHAPFPIRYAVNSIKCSCHGDTTELLRYEVPVDKKVYDCAQLPPSRKLLNKTISLEGSVLITFVHNPEDVLGISRGCYVPGQDTTIRGYYASVYMPKGTLYSVSNTMDSCPSDVQFRIEEHLDYKEVLDKYFLVPHKKQIILQVGYVVLHSNLNRGYTECSQELADSIFVRFPITQEQWDNKLRIFGKKYSEKGVAYKALTTKKVPSKISINIQCALNVTQLDTIFLGKRIQPEELDDYFFECETDMEQGSFTVEGKHYKAYRYDRHGEYEIKKPLRALLRIIDEKDVEIEDQKTDRRYADDEEIE